LLARDTEACLEPPLRRVFAPDPDLLLDVDRLLCGAEPFDRLAALFVCWAIKPTYPVAIVS